MTTAEINYVFQMTSDIKWTTRLKPGFIYLERISKFIRSFANGFYKVTNEWKRCLNTIHCLADSGIDYLVSTMSLCQTAAYACLYDFGWHLEKSRHVYNVTIKFN